MENLNLRKLKIKIKHLSLEPSIIRKEEEKALKQIKYFKAMQDTDNANKFEDLHFSLYCHRKDDVRNESRASHLAYAFLRNKPYSKTECNNKKPLNYYHFERIIRMCDKYKDRNKETQPITKERIEAWLQT